MNEKMNVFIYCRVLDFKAKDLLEEQEHILRDFAKDNHLEIVDVIKEVADGSGFASFGLEKLINKIVHRHMDAVFIYDETRISVHDDLFIEFELICQKHEIFIIPLRTLFFQNNNKMNQLCTHIRHPPFSVNTGKEGL